MIVSDGRKFLARELANPGAAAEHTLAECRALFFGEDNQFQRKVRVTILTCGAKDFQWNDDAGHAVVITTVRDRIDV